MKVKSHWENMVLHIVLVLQLKKAVHTNIETLKSQGFYESIPMVNGNLIWSTYSKESSSKQYFAIVLHNLVLLYSPSMWHAAAAAAGVHC